MKKLLGILLVLGAVAGAFYAYLILTPPRLILHLDTRPAEGQVWMNGLALGKAPLEIDLTGRSEPWKRGPGDRDHSVVNVIFGGPNLGKENVVELDCYAGRWKYSRFRFEAESPTVPGTKAPVNFVGGAPEIEKVGFRNYRVTLVLTRH